MAAHVRLKNEFTEDEKCHNVISWLKHDTGRDENKTTWFQARVSEDYLTLEDQWKVGVSSILARALRIQPSKDTFWTTSVQPGNPYSSVNIVTMFIESSLAARGHFSYDRVLSYVLINFYYFWTAILTCTYCPNSLKYWTCLHQDFTHIFVTFSRGKKKHIWRTNVHNDYLNFLHVWK